MEKVMDLWMVTLTLTLSGSLVTWCILKKLRQITLHIRLYVITFKSLPGGCDLQQGLWECSD